MLQSLQPKSGVKVLGMAEVDHSQLNLDYDNLKFNRDVIDGLEIVEYNEEEPP